MAERPQEGTPEGHVMLSYQWDHQKTILKIGEKLKDAGIPVWIDVEADMGSGIFEALARAIRDCSVFILAVSKKYQESANLRTEAMYAEKLNKPIIPLLMETDCKPDGWLAVLMRDSVYYNFSGKKPFDNVMSELLIGIKRLTGRQAHGSTKPKSPTKDTGKKEEVELETPQQQLKELGPSQTPSKGHVMLSYSWKQEEVILKICQKLRDAGIPVWIDKDHMRGDMIEAMNKAVKDCSIFLMAMSKDYQDSDNCKHEAAAAFKKKRLIIPLLVEKGYKPDGWVDFLQGFKLYYNFTGKRPFDSVMKELLTAVKEVLSS